MRTIAHLSNLRIGSAPKSRLQKIEAWMERLQPSLLVCSGGLTTSGTDWQLHDAREFLSRLPAPQLVLPGDSDAPRWDPISRLFSPWENFETYFGKNRTPYFADNEMVIAGVRTAVAWPFSKPAIGPSEQLFIHELMNSAEAGLAKALVCHHPVFLPDKFEPREEDERVFRSQVDVYIVGQLWGDREHQGQRESDTAVFVGTSRHDPVCFQILRLDNGHLRTENYVWDAREEDFCLGPCEERRLLLLTVRSA